MTTIVTGCVIALEALGFENVYAHRRWRDPDPGGTCTVVTSADDWAAMHTTAEAPTLRVLVYSAPSDGQADAETLALDQAAKVRDALHRPEGGVQYWGDLRTLSCLHVGSGLADVEGRSEWRCRSLTFEVQTG